MTIELPTGCVLKWTPSLVPQPATSKSAFGTNAQRIVRLGRHWRFDVTLHTMTQAKALEWSVIDEDTDTVLWKIPQSGLQNANEGTPRINGAGQLGTSLEIDNLSSNYVVNKGAFISILTGGRRYVHQVTATHTALGNGDATLQIKPPLRVFPGNNNTVEIAQPKVEGFAMWQNMTRNSRVNNIVRGASFTIEERG